MGLTALFLWCYWVAVFMVALAFPVVALWAICRIVMAFT